MKNIFLAIFVFVGSLSFSSAMNDREGNDAALEYLNDTIENLKAMLIEQDKMTPLDAICFVKPEGRDSLDYYKDILEAYGPFYDDNPQELYVKAYGPLAKILLGFIKKRLLCRECTNISEVACTPEETAEYMDYLGEWNFSPILPKRMIEKNEIPPIIQFIRDDKERIKKEKEFEPYFSVFEEEIRDQQEKKGINYRWFIMFSDQLSVLLSKLLYRSFSPVNTQYSAYFQYVDSQYDFPNFSKEKYMTGSERIKYSMSLPALINQFPAVFMVPHLFILEPLDFLRFVDGNQLVWPCGMIFGPEAADGWYHCPRNFYGHDWHHLGMLLVAMLNPYFFGKDIEFFTQDPEIFKEILFSVHNVFPLYCLLQKELYALISSIEDPDKKRNCVNVVIAYEIFFH